MKEFNLILLVVCLALVALQQAHSSDVDLKNPVRSAADDQIKSLNGQNFKFNQYSGYLNADDEKPANRFWHYWFVESQSDPAKDPLVLWLNGGPGCSSLLGLLTELGPFSVNSDGSLVDNPYSWNRRANIIFIESPAGVGFSYAANGDIKADDDTTAAQNHRALKSFFEKFPQYKGRDLYLTGESYGGVYLPTLAVLVDADPDMNLKGVSIGNGYLDANKLAESLIYFSYFHGLIGQTTWKGLSTECCDGKPPARGQCKFLDPKRSDKCDKFVNDATEAIIESGLNPYNLYDHCANPSQTVIGREHFDKSLMMHSFNVTNAKKTRLTSRHKRGTKFEIVRGDPPCTDDGIVIKFLNRDKIKDALHIPKGLKQQFTTCFDGIQYTMIYPASKNGLAHQVKELLRSPRKLKLLVYNGDVDMMCNFFGDEWFVDDLNVKLLADWAAWHFEDQIAGFVKHYEGISYMTVKGSGHMVPSDKPAEALLMFETFVFGHKNDLTY